MVCDAARKEEIQREHAWLSLFTSSAGDLGHIYILAGWFLVRTQFFQMGL